MQSIFRSVWAAMLQSLRRLVVLLLHVHVGATCHPKHIYMRYVADRFKKLTMVRQIVLVRMVRIPTGDWVLRGCVGVRLLADIG